MLYEMVEMLSELTTQRERERQSKLKDAFINLFLSRQLSNLT